MLHRYKKTLLQLFARIQLIRERPQESHAACLSVQEELITRITYIERQMRRLKRKYREYKGELRVVDPTMRLTKDQAASVKAELSACEGSIEDYQKLLILFREIGDALAFIYIDKYDIKPMAFKEGAGFLSGKKGTRLERKAWRMASLHSVAILNDVTNCLRYGDITIPFQGFPFLIEMKSRKGRSQREERQKEKLMKLGNYLTTDRVKDWYHAGQGEMVRQSLQSAEIDHRKELNELIDAAISRGYVASKIEEGLYYLVIATPGTESRALEELIPNFSEPPHLQVTFVNQLKQCNVAYTPFPLMIRRPENLFRFYDGSIVIIILEDVTVIREHFKKHGLTVTFLDDEKWCLKLLNNSPSDHELSEAGISSHRWGRLYGEFLSLRWLMDEIIHNVKNPQLDVLYGVE